MVSKESIMSRPSNQRSQAGFSLAEVLIATAVFVVVMVGALMLYDRSTQVFSRSMEQADTQQNTRVAFDKLVSDLRQLGFDFDRDGIPFGSEGGVAQAQQPDEQIEYIAPAAITIRSNFNYETASAPCPNPMPDPAPDISCDNGREPNLESPQFRVVTTANDEIVTYALVSDNGPNPDTISFFADVSIPRNAYPGGAQEGLVEIPNVDLCISGCNNPPYTLYRISLARNATNFTGGANLVRTPLAGNIRGMRFTYFADQSGTAPLHDVNNRDVSSGLASTTAAYGGGGRFNPNNPNAALPERITRARIQSIGVDLWGMGDRADFQYVNTAETLTSIENYRQYHLSSLVSPRNINKRGMKEQDTLPPGPPTITQLCTGACGMAYIAWEPHVANAMYGAPDGYTVTWQPSHLEGWGPSAPTTQPFLWVPNLIPNVEYKFRVQAFNGHGSMSSVFDPAFHRATPINTTKMNGPANLVATGDPIATALPNAIQLTWTRPLTNASGNYGSCVIGGSLPIPSEVPFQEINHYEVVRERTDGSESIILTSFLETADLPTTMYNDVTFIDRTAQNCIPYRYKVRAIERCIEQAAFNNPADTDYAVSGVVQITGQANSQTLPVAPQSLHLDASAVNGCDPSGNCDATLVWDKTKADVNGVPLTIGTYYLDRLHASDGTLAHTTTVTAVLDPASPDYHPTQVSQAVSFSGAPGALYRFQVRCAQCTPELISAPSDSVLFPCTFTDDTGVMWGTPQVTSNAFDGDGVNGPWLVDSSAYVRVHVSGVASVRAVVTDSAQQTVLDVTRNAGPYEFTFPTFDDTLYEVRFFIVNSQGCMTVLTRWVEDSGMSCCLIPTTIDQTVMSYVSGDNFVNVYAKNACARQLQLTAVLIEWDRLLISTHNNAALSRVSFPSGTGRVDGSFTSVALPACTETLLTGCSPPGTEIYRSTVTVPANADRVAASSSAYRIGVHFNPQGNRLMTVNPIRRMESRYLFDGLTTAEPFCPIVPLPQTQP
jgi:type II secretory pathway pseudopilin PulG